MKKVRFVNLQITDKDERKELMNALESTMNSGQFILGEAVESFEKSMSDFFGGHHVLGVASGTSALILALKALNISNGDEVIVPSISWLSTALAVSSVGATPVFADVTDELLIDPCSVERLLGEKTKAIISVDYMGKCSDFESLNKFDIPIIEDSSQSFGSIDQKGRKSGVRGIIGCISLNPMKQLAALGDAGVIITSDDKINKKLHALRYCGMEDREKNLYQSENHRIDALQASFLEVRLSKYESTTSKRIQKYEKYVDELPDSVKLLKVKKGEIPYALTIFAPRRDELIEYLQTEGIETKVQHRPLMCEQELYRSCRKDINRSEELVTQILSLPFYTDMSMEDIEYVCEKVRSFYER